ncbi:MAG: hypothetical protein K5923_03345 [Clostridia bacterium]|nr:hypothetical protein [Clostridia bacterium]
MKKTIILSVALVLVIAVSAVTFMGCQGTTSLTQIFSESNVWNEATFPEVFTYSMYKDGQEGSIGTLTMNVVKLDTSKTYYLGKDGIGTESDHVYGYTTASANATYMTTTTLTLLDGTYEQTSIAIFANNFKMLGTYSKVVEGEKVSVYVATNEDNKRYKYKTNADDFNEEYAIKNGKYITSPYFDNTMVYYVARSIPNDSTYSAFTFNIFDHQTNTKEKVTLTNSCDTTYPVVIGETTFNDCRKITMKTSDTLLGTTNYIECYLTAKHNNCKSVITKIVEGSYSYLLNV